MKRVTMADFPGAPRDSIRSSELHELACTGATFEEGCVCPEPKPSVLGRYKGVPDWQVVDYATHHGIDVYLSSLESLLIAFEQREMDEAELDRFARLLQYGERLALSRLRRRRKAP